MKESICICCQKNFQYKPKASVGKYCSNSCQQEHQYENRISAWLKGELEVSTKTIKRYLLERNPRCSVCGIADWMGKQIVFDLEHKDGNANNNHVKNVCLICPNCHSQTPTFKGRNKGNGRHFRRDRYAQGKSY